MRKLLLCSTLLIGFSLPGQDTFSICAVDTITGEVGSAGASCIDAVQIGNSIGCALISDVHPGVGVIHTQAYYIAQNQTYAGTLMTGGYTPQQILDSVQMNDIQGNSTIRQYGIVRLNGNSAQAAAFTGSNCMAYANHRVGPNYAIQGNILLGAQILDSMEARFLNTPGDLACKLMAAMQGAKVPGADTRCTSSGNSSLSAFLKVADGTGLTIDLVVPYGPTGFEPIDSLQTLFNNVHSCPVGIDESHSVIGVTISPNPVNDAELLHVQINGATEQGTMFELFDVRGACVLRRQIDMLQFFDIDVTGTGMISGNYYYRVIVPGKGVSCGKVVVQ